MTAAFARAGTRLFPAFLGAFAVLEFLAAAFEVFAAALDGMV
eukprot:COSAG02_NODE_3191_length_7197_cov_28.589321_5_plen_42_part_00